jgi:hypothetical protein
MWNFEPIFKRVNRFKRSIDAEKSTIHNYKADLERLSGYLSTNTAMYTITISVT